jgi:F0F1-type ATP synthase assembly protein I
MKKDSPGPPPKADANQWLAFLNLGWIFAITLLLCAGGGLWLDRRFGTSPLMLLAGVFLGFAASGYALYKAVKKLETQETQKPPK